jgi:hypothetical protein
MNEANEEIWIMFILIIILITLVFGNKIKTGWFNFVNKLI